MAKKKRLSPNKLATEKSYFANLKAIPEYHPMRGEYSVASIQTVEDEIGALLEQESQMVANLATLRDSIAEKGTLFVEKMDGAAVQIAAQFGEDSSEYQSLGRKRKSERRTGRNRTNGGNNNPPNG